ncbi:MAG: hypothetical protein NZL93_07025, partial [Chthoniobacterales bacterium]|nr:hypothetical protein [Chthoniobacterales bacterium]
MPSASWSFDDAASYPLKLINLALLPPLFNFAVNINNQYAILARDCQIDGFGVRPVWEQPDHPIQPICRILPSSGS